VSYHVEVTHYL